MKINTPNYVSQNGTITQTDGNLRDGHLREGHLREDNPLVRLVGQLIKAEVLQSVETIRQDDASPAPAANTASSQNAASSQKLFINTLQIGQSRIAITTEQPLPAGSTVTLKVLSALSVQFVDQANLSAPAATPTQNTQTDPATALLNTLLRQALPLQKPVTDLLATLTRILPLINATDPASTNNSLPMPRLGPDTVNQLKPLLAQLLRFQLTPETVAQPNVLREALAATGIFREKNLVAWAQQLLQPLSTQRDDSTSTSTSTSLPTRTLPQNSNLISQTLNTSSPQKQKADALIEKIIIGAANIPASAIAGADVDVPNESSDDDLLRAQILQAIAARSTKASPTPATESTSLPPTKPPGLLLGDNTRNAVNTTNADNTANADSKARSTVPPSALLTETQQNAPRSASGTAIQSTPLSASTPAPTPTPSLPTQGSLPIDTKTTLEHLVAFAVRQLIARTADNKQIDVNEELIHALLRNVPMQTQVQTTPSKTDVQDDSEWLMQLLRTGFGALKHLQLQQASNLGASHTTSGQTDNIPAPLQIELPLYAAQQWHNVNIEIEQRAGTQQAAADKTQRAWRVTLRFDLPDQGIIVAQLNLTGTDLNATLWAENHRTCDTLKQQMNELSKRLRDAGAHVAAVDIRHGQPAASKTRIEKRLIDIRT